MPRRSRARSARRQSPRRRTEGARGGACALRGYLWRPVRALRGGRESPRSMRWLRAQLSNQQWAAGPVSHRGRARVGRSSGERSRALALERRRATASLDDDDDGLGGLVARSVVMGAAQRVQCVYAARSGAQGRQVVTAGQDQDTPYLRTQLIFASFGPVGRVVVYTVQFRCSRVGVSGSKTPGETDTQTEPHAEPPQNGARRSCEHPMSRHLATTRQFWIQCAI
jgi:hypothetical protein